MFKKLDDLLGLDRFFEDLKVEVPDGDAGDDREGFPVEVKLGGQVSVREAPRCAADEAVGSNRFRR